ncbi:sodium-coupled monocarboxylate transporter 1-like protein 2 [Dinothrombium tinctorium]|uniref:Sodium-coupled monocarboxylate transporter 1-like protein 2 n=2 Tax=Dinothrombium tinctorium TaxID=1965070 RepID=A0A443QQ53_9ACAR|nr:sodium-coupled monocarboxylate transporter 1-like protein 2 [Dinothrombium tinctorium]
MEKTTFSFLDYLVFILTLALSASIGAFFWFKDRKNQSNREYLTGGRNLPIFPVAMSLAASFMSSNTLLGAPAEIYMLGTQFGLSIIAFLIAAFLAANLFMPIYYDLELTSINKYLLRRFNTNSIRVLGSIAFILSTLPYMAAVLYGPAVALSIDIGLVKPFQIAKEEGRIGAIAGLLTGVTMTMTIAVGSVVNKKPRISLDLRTDSCTLYGIEIAKNFTLPGAYSPEGINKLFHISYFFIPVTGFVVCVTIGIIVSIITGKLNFFTNSSNQK